MTRRDSQRLQTAFEEHDQALSEAILKYERFLQSLEHYGDDIDHNLVFLMTHREKEKIASALDSFKSYPIDLQNKGLKSLKETRQSWLIKLGLTEDN